MVAQSASEALARRAGGRYDGQPCTCTEDSPLVCDGDRCRCEACARAWIDAGLDALIGPTWRSRNFNHQIERVS